MTFYTPNLFYTEYTNYNNMSKTDPIVSEITKQALALLIINSANQLITQTLITIFPNHYTINSQSLTLITPGKII